MVKRAIKRVKKSKTKPRAPRTPRAIMDSYIQKYLGLLRDPCGGELVSPPYAGTDGGYLIRTTDSFVPQVTGVGMTVGPISASAVINFAPGNYGYNGTSNSAWLGAAFGPGGADPAVYAYASAAAGSFSNGTANNNFLSAGSVAQFRPVACCLKWVPTGAYSSRAGLVCLSYIPGAGSLGGTALYSALQNGAQHLSLNGSELHEVRWLFIASDESWSNPVTIASTPGCGTVRLVLRGVDGVASAATVGTINGYVEATTVWEWVPNVGNGVTSTPRVPVPYTTQDLLSRIGNKLGDFLYNSMPSHTYGQVARGITGSMSTGYRLLTAGMGHSETRSPAFLLSM